jgi:hypothetical protein
MVVRIIRRMMNGRRETGETIVLKKFKAESQTKPDQASVDPWFGTNRLREYVDGIW